MNTVKERTVGELSDAELNRHLRVFSDNIYRYAPMFGITIEQMEYIRRQYLALSWIITMNEKISTYAQSILVMQKQIRLSTYLETEPLAFLDLPRPPVFYPQGNINRVFGAMVKQIKSSDRYSQGIGRELGIELLYA